MKITNYIVEQIYKLGLANEKLSIEIYRYGINTGINILLNILVIFFVAMFQSKIIICFEFFLFFIPLRSTSGGFHFSSKHICSVISTIVFSLILKFQDFIYKNSLPFFIFAFFCSIFIIAIPTRDNKSRKLSAKDILFFQKKKVFLIKIFLMTVITLLLFNQKVYVTPILSAIILVAALLIADVIVLNVKNKRKLQI